MPSSPRSTPYLSTLTLGLLGACSAPEPGGANDVASTASSLEALPVLSPNVLTPPLHGYDDAPRAPDSDDPAIWVGKRPGQALLIGALKDAGMQVYDLAGNVVQTIVPPNHPALVAEDPPAPGPEPDPGTSACPESESGETFGRYNNVDVHYGFKLRRANGRTDEVDIAVVTDRGCDRLRVYAIDPGAAGGPLVDVTSPDVPRAFPQRFEQPSPLQSPGESPQLVENSLDEQSTAYGITLYARGHDGLHAFVTQRRRSVVAEFVLKSTASGVSYDKLREFRFNPAFRLRAADRERIGWSPCREDVNEDPQFEGLVVDRTRGILYAAQEATGIWRIPLSSRLPALVEVPEALLFERTRSFGQAYWAVPEDDEFSCESEAPDPLPPGTVVSPGVPDAVGPRLEADAEGLAIYYGAGDSGYLIASSQGDDTFHLYDLRNVRRHLGSFQLEGTGETDGHDVVNVRVGSAFPFGLFVAQNGKAPPPASEDPINGFEYDNSTQFELIGWEKIADAFGLQVHTGR